MIALFLAACLIIAVFGQSMAAIYVWVGFLLAVCAYFYWKAYSLTWVPERASVLTKVRPPETQWRFHDSDALYQCTNCNTTSREGWWTPWTFDEVEGWHSDADKHYCTSCVYHGHDKLTGEDNGN